ncbi:MAG: hypothetical protein WBX81_01935 [Nitrososphaeraceae archaeon]
MNRCFYCIDCVASIEEELTPISSQVFIIEECHFGANTFFLICSGYIPPPMLDKVDKKRKILRHTVLVEKSRE